MDHSSSYARLVWDRGAQRVLRVLGRCLWPLAMGLALAGSAGMLWASGTASALTASLQPTPGHTLSLTGTGLSYEQRTAPGRSLRLQALGGLDTYLHAGNQLNRLGVGIGVSQRFYNNGEDIRSTYVEPIARLALSRVQVGDASVQALGVMVGGAVGWKGIWSGLTVDAQVGYGLTLITASAHTADSHPSANAAQGTPILELGFGYSW